jgi:hypothetical protein
MLHACLHTICFVFCYTSWHFYAFSGTNLLTRCYSASSMFSAIFVFQKSYTGNSQNWKKQKLNLLFLPKLREDRRWDGGGPGASHTIGWCGLAPDCATWWWGQLAHLLKLPFCLYIPLNRKNLKDKSLFLETYCNRRHHCCEIGRIQELFPAPCRRGESLPEAFSTTMIASRVMCE